MSVPTRGRTLIRKTFSRTWLDYEYAWRGQDVVILRRRADGAAEARRGRDRSIWTRRHDDGGAAAVEFALILPILMLLVMGIIEFSQAFNTKEVLQYAVREGARDLALGKTETVAAQTTRDRADTISDPASIGITTVPCPSPLPASTPAQPFATATVTATYSLPYSIPFLSSGAWSLSATGVMRCAG